MALYHGSQFFVSDQKQDSKIHPISRGIKQGCPLSPYLFVIVLSALTHDLHELFYTFFQYHPWTFSSTVPFPDIEYADDTVLMARSHETLMRLLHLLQHLAARIGLLLNGSKCQLLSIHSTLPISLSTTVTSDQPCQCPHCSPFLGTDLSYHSLDEPLTPLTSAKYLGSFITPTSSSNPDIQYRCSQASQAFKCLDPFFRHTLISPKRKLQVYSQIVQSILLHGSESQIYSPAQSTRLESLHYKALRQIFQIKSPYCHRVLNPTEAPCSNDFLLSLAYPVLPSLVPPSIKISDKRIKYLGHILRHPDSLEHKITFNPSMSLRSINSLFRRGAPRAHWPELALSEATFKLQIFRTNAPNPGEFTHPYYTHFTIAELKSYSSTSMKNWYNTTHQLHTILPVATDRELWLHLTPKMK